MDSFRSVFMIAKLKPPIARILTTTFDHIAPEPLRFFLDNKTTKQTKMHATTKQQQRPAAS